MSVNEPVKQAGVERVSAPVLSLDLQGLGYGDTPVLGPMTLVLTRGETLAITGPSGIGKSSLLRAIAGLHGDWQGHCDKPARIAMVFQEPTLLPWRTALQNITLTTGVPDAAAEKVLDEVGLGGLGARFPAQLSLGQQRRLSLARAFAAEPDLLLMDEPFVSLDPALADEMMTLFCRLRDARHMATLLVTHVEAEADRLADRVIRLAGTPAVIAG